MCAILTTNDPVISESDFRAALALMHHRGPDAGGYHAEGPVKMGHARLKILDLDDRSNQPFWSHDGRYAIVYNGEIYNYKELAKDHGIAARTTGDTEVLLELYRKLGKDMLGCLNGMFAFMIFDRVSGETFIARDRLGVKPLYLRQTGRTVTVASEISALLKLSNGAPVDETGLRQYRKLRTFFNGRTLYKGVSMFPAGHFMLDGKLSKYWSLPEGEQAPPSDDELFELVRSAVDYRCISDVPVGSYLSGGLDSTIVAGLASKPCTWTVGFPEDNEFSWSEIAAKKFKSEHAKVPIEYDEFLALAKTMIQIRHEPLSVPNEVLLYKMSLEVKKKNTVVLSGEGADELFFGYDRIFRWASQNTWDPEVFSRLYAYGSNEDPAIVEDALRDFTDKKDALKTVARFFQVAHLHGLLRRLDNSTMLCSVEARVPFVDYRLVERMAGVPFEYRMKDGVVKAPLKRVFSSIVPREIIDRPKIGFPVPLAKIFNTPQGKNPMDSWLEFNLEALGVQEDMRGRSK